MWNKFKQFGAWVDAKWDAFEQWVAIQIPGVKTKIIAALGALGLWASAMQEFVSGLPLEQFVTGRTVAITGAILFTLAFWTRRLTDKS